jgi:hypothetical protein
VMMYVGDSSFRTALSPPSPVYYGTRSATPHFFGNRHFCVDTIKLDPSSNLNEQP